MNRINNKRQRNRVSWIILCACATSFDFYIFPKNSYSNFRRIVTEI